MDETVGPSVASPLRRLEPLVGYPSKSPDYWQFDMAALVTSYLVPPHSDGVKNTHSQAAGDLAMPFTTSLTILPPIVPGYLRNTLYHGGFQPGGQCLIHIGRITSSVFRGFGSSTKI